MAEISINLPTDSYPVIVGSSLAAIAQRVEPSNTFIITDAVVARLHGSFFPSVPTFVLNHGEQAKNLSALSDIYTWLLNHNANRHSTLLGIGGGAVCDVAGFVAATFMRGIGLALAPTTLLAQIDAAVGGKNGLNLLGFKNIVGTFYQPRFVYCDPALLATLSAEELQSGLGEMVKYAIIDANGMFERMEQQTQALRDGNAEAMAAFICDSVRIKARIVSADEREMGLRRILNLGHTWGHAVERETSMPHGLCVSVGLEFAARLSVAKQLLSFSDYERIVALLRALGLPTAAQIDAAAAFATMRFDKKRRGAGIDFVLIRGIGDVFAETIETEELAKFLGLH